MTETEKEKLKKLTDLFQMVNDSLTKEEFIKSFQKVMEFVVQVEQKWNKKNAEVLELLLKTTEQLTQNLKDANIDEVQKVKKEFINSIQNALNSVSSALKEQENGMNFIRDKVRKIKEGKDGKDGKDADEGKIIQEVLSKIELPKPKDIVATEIRDKLQTLKEDNRLDKTAIKGLEDEIIALKKSISEVPRGRMGGGRKVPIIKRINLTSQVDGNTRAFTVQRDTVDVLGLFGSQFPINFDTADWTFSGNTITLAAAISTPLSGQTLFAICEVLFYG